MPDPFTHAALPIILLLCRSSRQPSHPIVTVNEGTRFLLVVRNDGSRAWDPALGDPPIEADSDGVPRMMRKLAHFTPLNDADYLEDMLKQHHNSIGAFLIEPIMGNCCSTTATVETVVATPSTPAAADADSCASTPKNGTLFLRES